MAYTVEAGNVHDSQAFPSLFSKLEPFSPRYIIADSGYKTPAIAHYLLERNIIPAFPYTRPKGVKGNLRPSVLFTMLSMAVTSAQRTKC